MVPTVEAVTFTLNTGVRDPLQYSLGMEFLPKPEGTVEDITCVRRVMSHRHRDSQPQINQPYQDTVPGEGSGDE